MENNALWEEPAKGCLIDVELVREKNITTKLIRFQFAGTDPEYIKTVHGFGYKFGGGETR